MIENFSQMKMKISIISKLQITLHITKFKTKKLMKLKKELFIPKTILLQRFENVEPILKLSYF
jgi:hypothetical protein